MAGDSDCFRAMPFIAMAWSPCPKKKSLNAVQAAATQSAEDTVIDILQQWCSATDKNRSEQSSLARVKSTTLTDRATTIMNQNCLENIKHIIEKTVSTTKFLLRFRWHRILDGTVSTITSMEMSRNYPRSSTGKQTFLHQID